MENVEVEAGNGPVGACGRGGRQVREAGVCIRNFESVMPR